MGSKRETYAQREGRMPGVRFVEFTGDCCAEAVGFTLHANVRVHGRRRKLVAFITEAPVLRAILQCLNLPNDPPLLSPARWPP